MATEDAGEYPGADPPVAAVDSRIRLLVVVGGLVPDHSTHKIACGASIAIEQTVQSERNRHTNKSMLDARKGPPMLVHGRARLVVW